MTHEDYALVADVLENANLPSDLLGILALRFAKAFKDRDPTFRPVRFCMATIPRLADSEAIKANNAKGFIGPLRGCREMTERLMAEAEAEGFERTLPDGTIQHWRPVGKQIAES